MLMLYTQDPTGGVLRNDMVKGGPLRGNCCCCGLWWTMVRFHNQGSSIPAALVRERLASHLRTYAHTSGESQKATPVRSARSAQVC